MRRAISSRILWAFFFAPIFQDQGQLTPNFFEIAEQMIQPTQVELAEVTAHPALGYEVVAIVDKAIRYKGAATRAEVERQAGTLVSATGQTISIFELMPPDARGVRHFRLVDTYDVSTGAERVYDFRGVTKTSVTRTGFYNVKVMYEKYVSRTFGENMPYSVGYDPDFGTYIHETRPDWCDSYISTRRSAGCTRLCAGPAKSFYNLAYGKGRGWVAKFEDESGRLKKWDARTPMFVQSWKTLVINTDTTPKSFRGSVPDLIAGRPVVRINPQVYRDDPDKLFELFSDGTYFAEL